MASRVHPVVAPGTEFCTPSTLLDVSRSVASTLERQPLLDAVLDALGSVVDFTGGAILAVDEASERLRLAHRRGPASLTAETAWAIRYRIEDFGPAWERLGRDEPVVIADVRAETGEAAIFRRLAGDGELETTYGFIRSAMWVPLVVRGRMVGLLSIADPAPAAYGPREASLALAIARQAAVAMENARLHERAQWAARSKPGGRTHACPVTSAASTRETR